MSDDLDGRLYDLLFEDRVRLGTLISERKNRERKIDSTDQPGDTGHVVRDQADGEAGQGRGT